MQFIQKFRRGFRPVAAAITLCALAGQAQALDGQDLLAKLGRTPAGHGQFGLEADSVEVSGSDVILHGTRVKLPRKIGRATGGGDLAIGGGQTITARPDGDYLQIDTVRLTGVTEENGAYRIERADFDDIHHSEDQFAVNLTDIYLSKLFVPSGSEASGLDAFPFYENAHVGRSELKYDGRTVLSIDEAVAAATPSPDRSSFDFSGRIATVRGDLTGAGKPEAQEDLRRLGLDRLEGKVTLNGSWTLSDGRFVLDDYTFDFANIGKLDIKLDLSGYTLDFLQELAKSSAALEAVQGNQEESQKAAFAVFALLQQLSINSAEIRFDDAGITNRGIDLAALRQNATPAQIRQFVKAFTPIVLAQFRLADLQNIVTDAVSRYIDAPENFSIKAEPARPVPVPAIIGAGIGAPQTLPTLLGVTVTANGD